MIVVALSMLAVGTVFGVLLGYVAFVPVLPASDYEPHPTELPVAHVHMLRGQLVYLRRFS